MLLETYLHFSGLWQHVCSQPRFPHVCQEHGSLWCDAVAGSTSLTMGYVPSLFCPSADVGGV